VGGMETIDRSSELDRRRPALRLILDQGGHSRGDASQADGREQASSGDHGAGSFIVL